MSWKDISEAYLLGSRDKVVVTPEIQKLADDLTTGETDRLEQTRIIYNWVRTNIRYVIFRAGDGEVVPHKSSDILANRYGDCKDHVVLLEAMLKAKGIESHGVLIGSKSNYQVNSIQTPLLFDHIITYVPEFDIYLDATNEFMPFNVGNSILASQSVLHVGGHQNIMKMPPMEAEDNKQISSTHIVWSKDGSLQGSIEDISSGRISEIYRSILSRVSPLSMKGIVKSLLEKKNQDGDGTLEFDPVLSDNRDYRVGLKFKVNGSGYDFSGPVALTVNQPISLVDALEDAILVSQNTQNAPCTATDITLNYKIELPEGVVVDALPEDINFADGRASYTATYEQVNNIVSVSRHYVMTVNKGLCSSEELVSISEVAKVAQDDLESEIQVKPQV